MTEDGGDAIGEGPQLRAQCFRVLREEINRKKAFQQVRYEYDGGDPRAEYPGDVGRPKVS